MDSEADIREYKTVTKRTKTLLDKQESYDLDFKEKLNGVHTEDFVSFANSKNGGTILVGVKEDENNKGQQKGKIIGCHISDKNKMTLISKATSCTPSVEIEIFAENINVLPIYRIEIPSGKYKPYCISKGQYYIRSDGRNAPITPDMLLDIFLDRQGQVLEILDNIDNLAKKVTYDLKEIFKVSEDANSFSDQAMYNSDEALGEITELSKEIENIQGFVYNIDSKVDALLKKFNIEDPRLTRIKSSIKQTTVKLYEKFQDKEEVMDMIKGIYDSSKISLEIIETCVNEVLNDLKDK